jgi:hypothetical protein
MVEAAIVFPLVIASVMALIYIMINLYCFTAVQSALHIELRGESGRNTGLTEIELTDGYARDRYRAAAERRSFSIDERKKVIRPYIEAESTDTYEGNAMSGPGVERTVYGRYYLIDEGKLIRNLSMVSDVISDSDTE